MTQPETITPRLPINYLVAFTNGRDMGSAIIAFPLPVTGDDLPGIVETLAGIGHPGVIILAVSRLAPNRVAPTV